MVVVQRAENVNKLLRVEDIHVQIEVVAGVCDENTEFLVEDEIESEVAVRQNLELKFGV